MWYVYILQSELNGSFYKGHTNDIAFRLKEHNNGEEPYTSKFVPWKLRWCCSKPSKKMAYQLELKLKNLSRKKIEEFIAKYYSDNIANVIVRP